MELGAFSISLAVKDIGARKLAEFTDVSGIRKHLLRAGVTLDQHV